MDQVVGVVRTTAGFTDVLQFLLSCQGHLSLLLSRIDEVASAFPLWVAPARGEPRMLLSTGRVLHANARGAYLRHRKKCTAFHGDAGPPAIENPGEKGQLAKVKQSR